MVQEKVHPPRYGEIVAEGISAEEYLADYAESHHEWVRGFVIAMSPVHVRHNQIIRYLILLFSHYFSRNPIGFFEQDPFVMRLKELDVWREPDIQIILNSNLHPLKDTYMDGPADICIEVISHGTESVDRVEKFREYEEGGVGEYWILDHFNEEALFHRLGEDGKYQRISVGVDGIYQSPKLPKLNIHVLTLWQQPLPNALEVHEMVKQMWEES